MNEFLQILNNNEPEKVSSNMSQPEIKEEEEEEQQLQPCDAAWSVVLTNAFYLYYPGPGGDYKEPEFLRPLYVALNALRQAGAGLVRVKRTDGSEHFRLVQGTMPADKWEESRKRLTGDKDKLMWLFTLSITGIVGKEEMIRQREIEVGLLEETARRLEGKNKTMMEIAARQLRMKIETEFDRVN